MNMLTNLYTKSLIMKTFKYFLLILWWHGFLLPNLFSQQAGRYEKKDKAEYLPQTVILKLKEEYRDVVIKGKATDNQLKSYFQQIHIDYIKKIFPNHQPPKQELNAYGQKLVDLSLIYKLKYNTLYPLKKVISQLKNTGFFEYVEPCYISGLFYVPNDPFADTSATGNFRQYALINTRAFQGWDVHKGDSLVVIGIVDTGTDIDHADLGSNIFYNLNDTIDGIDNDNDGFIDNYMGWDLGENDNNPTVNQIGHGAHVSGISSAATDNNLGIAGTGFKCRFLPVKIDDENGNLTMDYAGIVYAADHECDIINCSWGGKFGNGNFGQDVVNYATYNRDALVIAACGNDDDEGVFYPASYKNVLSVAATNAYDEKWVGDPHGSNYNIFVDISAPGHNIYSTIYSNSYAYSSGTSMAAPAAAGLAAIVKSHFPNYNALQVGEQLRATADNIDTIAANLPYKEKLGKGRANLFRALTENPPSIRLVNNDFMLSQAIYPGDTLEIIAPFINYLADAQNLQIKLTGGNDHITIIDSIFYKGIATNMEEFSNAQNPFRIYIHPGVPNNEELSLKLQYEANNYTDFEYFNLILNHSFVDIDTNRIAASVCADGRLVYHDEFSSLNHGFLYDDVENLLYCGGLMLGISSNQVSDNVYGNDGGYNQDFYILDGPTVFQAQADANFAVKSIFNDSLATFNKIGVEVIQNVYAWSNHPDDKYIIFEFQVVNQSGELLYPLYAGFFADWDVGSSSHNKAAFDAQNKMAYIFPVEGGIHTSVKLLNPSAYHHYAIDNNGTGGDINLYNSNYFSTYEKFLALTNDRNAAGLAEGGNDVSHVLTAAPLSIPAGDTAKVAFALMAGDNLFDIQNSAVKAQQKYYEWIKVKENTGKTPFSVKVFPNPSKGKIILMSNIPEKQKFQLKIVDVSGMIREEKTIFLENGNNLIFTHKFLPKGLYFLHLQNNETKHVKKLVIQ